MTFYKVFQVDENTWRIEDCFRSYMYLIEGAERALLFDTGMGLPGLAQCIKQLTDKPVVVVNSHGHLDHIGGNCQFDECFMNPNDREAWEEHTEISFRKRLLNSFAEEFCMRLSEKELCEMAEAGGRVPFLPIKGGQVINLGKRRLEIIDTPGHTRGSICLLDKDRRMLFSADNVCDQGVLLFFSHSASVAEFADSIRLLKARSREYDEIWPGHHKCPLDLDYLEEYEACALRILKNPDAGKEITSNLGTGKILFYKRISITYKHRSG